MARTTTVGERALTDRAIGAVERIGNKLPNPLVLFSTLLLVVGLFSALGSALGWTVKLPGAGAQPVHNLFSGSGAVYLLESLIPNFTSFPALGAVLTVTLGLAVAQGTGALEAAVRLVFSRVPAALVPYAVAFVACQGHVMSDASLLVLPALAALVFKAVGRHPLAGLIGAYACIASGYAGGLLMGTLDASLAGITAKAATLLPSADGYTTNIAMNYYFGAAAGLVLPIVGGLLISRVLEPSLPAWTPPEGEDGTGVRTTRRERFALLSATAAVLAMLGAIMMAWLLPGSPLRGEGGALIPSPLLTNLVVLVALSFGLFGWVYGRAVGLPKEERDVMKLMTTQLRDMAGFVVLIFIVAQLVAVLSWTNLAAFLASNLADSAKAAGIGGLAALLLLVLVSSVLNLLITSGSGLWALESSVMVPTLMMLGLSPAAIQAAHRIGDSVTQSITPMNVMLYYVVDQARKYDPNIQLGTFISRSLPFVPAFAVVWCAVLAAFYFLGLPVGPGAGISLP